MSRIESGPVQFGEDWPGVFIRGDNAFAIALALRNILEDKVHPIDKVHLQCLLNDLEGCRADTGYAPQWYPSPFCNCGKRRAQGNCSGHCDNDE